MKFLINDDLRFIIGWSRKSACGSVKQWFTDVSKIDRKGENYHSFFRKNTNWLQVKEGKKYLEYKKFIVIRNPYKRLVSGYTDKHVFLKAKAGRLIRAYQNFEQFVTYLECKMIQDIHFLPQVSEDFPIAMQYGWEWDLIIDVDTLNEGIEKINRLLGVDVKIGHYGLFAQRIDYDEIPKPAYLMTGEEIRKYNPAYRHYYNEHIKEKVDNIYKVDFDFFSDLGFNYETEK